MKVYRPPGLFQLFYSGAYFSFPAPGRTIYLTFDDGPTDGVTQPILEVLEKRGVPATFFVSGTQVEESPSLFELLQDRGYAIGNHGYKHLDGFKTSNADYIENVIKGAELSRSDYFRPPYGKITLSQFKDIKNRYRVVFWSLMPYDFDRDMPEKKILQILKSGIRPGSIIALHDNTKSKAPGLLDEFIMYCIDRGYSFDTLHRLNLLR